jgi:tRNA-specific 2-thiouridylase
LLAGETASNTVTVGPREALRVGSIGCIRPTWTGGAHEGSWRGLVQVRAHGAAMPATVTASGEAVSIELDAPAYGIAPGQAAVYYSDDLVVGSATIATTNFRKEG